MIQPVLRTVLFFGLAVVSALASAQQGGTAQQRYNEAVARCNDSNLPRPDRNACIRDAGIALEQARGGRQQAGSPDTIPDARSTVVEPSGAIRRADDSDSTYTTPDGRAVVVPPARN